MCSILLFSYSPNLPAQELDQALATLAASARRAEWLLCRYRADIADERRFRAVGWYSDVLHYARERFGFGVKSTRERVRIGRALRDLPRVEEAFVAGALSYSRVREVTRVATAETEQDWLRLAQRLSMRELERRVAGQIGAKEVCDSPATATWRTPETIELSMRLPAETWALLKRAMEGARQASESPMSDAEALEAVAREALTVLAQPDSTDIADPRKAVVLYQCGDCRQTGLETNAGAVTLSDKAAERLTAGAKRIDLATEGRCEACVAAPCRQRFVAQCSPATAASAASAAGAATWTCITSGLNVREVSTAGKTAPARVRAVTEPCTTASYASKETPRERSPGSTQRAASSAAKSLGASERARGFRATPATCFAP